jgi:putative phosphoribosyl transferase
MFENRSTAGRWLAERVPTVSNKPNLVLGISAASLCVGAEVAERLHAPLDAWLARPLSTGTDCIGAVAEGNAVCVDPRLAVRAGLVKEELHQLVDQTRRQLDREAGVLRGSRWLPRVRGRAIVVVSDAILDGKPEHCVLKALSADCPAWVVLASPVATPVAIAEVRDLVNELIILESVPDSSTLENVYRRDTVPPLQGLAQLLTSPAAALDAERWRHIAVGVDFSPGSIHAAKLAASLARRDRASVTLVHMTEEKHLDDPDHPAHSRMAELAHDIRTDEVSVWTRVESGTAHRQLPICLASIDADLLVVAGSHKGWLAHAFHRSVSDGLARSPSVPVLVAAEHSAAELPRRIVVGVDYTEASEIAIRYGAAQAYLNEAMLDVAHVQAHGPTEKLERFCRQRIHGFAQNPRFRALQVDGASPSGALMRHASACGADLVVVGSHDRALLLRALTASTAENLIHSLPCHVLIAPTPTRVESSASANLPVEVSRTQK